LATLGQIVDSMEEALFVGRGAEMAFLRAWLAEVTPARPRIINVTGPGGIGKTALTRALCREVTRQGQPATLVDLASIKPTAPHLLAAIAGGDHADPVEHINRVRPVIILDQLEAFDPLSGYVRDELLPALDARVKVVISGRRPLVPTRAGYGVWPGFVHPLPLAGLSRAASCAYLERRGVADARVCGQILQATGGHPLALALACDMASQLGIVDFDALAEWRLVVRSLVGELLEEVDDDAMREVIQACSIVRQFDESVLSAVAGVAEVSDAFGRLCHLSVVRPSSHGLALHDVVRHMLDADLRWRNPDRHRRLRERAFAHYHERMQRTVSAEEQDWILSDCFYLLENEFLQRWAFNRHEPSGTWVDRPPAGDRHGALELFAAHGGALRCPPEELDRTTVGELLAYDGTDVRLLRDARGAAVAFSLVVPLCVESMPLLPPAASRLVQAHWDDDERAALPRTAGAATSYLLTRIVADPGAEGGPELATLARDLLGIYAGGGTYFLSTSSAVDQTVARVLGYECLPAAEVRPPGGGQAVEGFVLDLARIGVRPWLEAVTQGKPPPKAFAPAEIEDALRAVLLGWRDDEILEGSALRELVSSRPGIEDQDVPTALRQAVLAALAAARADADPQAELAYRAVELADLDRPVSNERAAERLSVSRSSFYRALRRGVAGIAEALVRSQRTWTD
jgi:hypothetical protein